MTAINTEITNPPTVTTTTGTDGTGTMEINGKPYQVELVTGGRAKAENKPHRTFFEWLRGYEMVEVNVQKKKQEDQFINHTWVLIKRSKMDDFLQQAKIQKIQQETIPTFKAKQESCFEQPSEVCLYLKEPNLKLIPIYVDNVFAAILQSKNISDSP